MPDVPVDKKFAVLCEITRAQHFAWRQAVVDLCPGVDVAAVVNRMWEVTGEQTAASYLSRIDPDGNVALQVAQHIAWSSACMGEQATAEAGPAGDDATVRHTAGPWFRWHDKLGLLAEDRPGCDCWFRSTLDAVNAALGTRLRLETVESLPEGGASCLRRICPER